MNDVVQVGICGLGNVGRGTLKVLSRNATEIARRAGCPIKVVQIASRRQPEIVSVPFTSDILAVARNPQVHVVVEAIGGVDSAYELVKTAIENGKHVVTANKALLALKGNELFAAAQQRDVTIAFEGAVAGGVPVIKAIREGLAGNRIDWVAGIINGTNNFILSAMDEKGADFGATLAEAQRLGYAEADPTFDIGGIDAAHKLTILASIAFGVPLSFSRAYVEGISAVTAEDIEYARQLGYRIKHLGITRRRSDGIELRVHPTLVPANHLLAHVGGAMNAVMVFGDALGPSMFYGPGAGSEPTASAVVADLVDLARARHVGAQSRVPHLGFQANAITEQTILPADATESAYYLRIPALDRPGVLAQIARILSEEGISIESLIQKEQAIRTDEGEAWVPVIILTQRVLERNLNRALGGIRELDDIRGNIARIRVDNFRK